MAEIPLVNANWAGIFSTIINWLEVLAIAAAIIAGFYFLFRFLQYDKRVIVIEQRANTRKIFQDRARLSNKDGDVEYKFLKRKKESMIVPSSTAHMIGRTDTLVVERLGFGLYRPIHIKDDTIKIVDYNVLAHYKPKLTRQAERSSRPSFLMQHSPELVYIAVVIVIGIVLVVLLNKIDGLTTALSAGGG